MATRMLIDARHPEETRVAVLTGNRIEEFDFESAEHKQIKGNIYLAKVTRVEPSLQAAFVDFGGNRHGFLAFSEIHPDYYQIPQQDREALLAEEQAHADEEAALRAAEDEDEDGDSESFDDASSDHGDEDGLDGVEEIDTDQVDDVATIEDGHVENGDEDEPASEEGESRGRGRGRRPRRQGSGGGSRSRAKEMDALREKRQALRRRYKIQDVIQRRQVLLVQVVKEERGNKGAALTTYLSLAGRYCVLMPNSSHGGGISRKISSSSDRKRLKQIVGELSLPRSMGLIVRTAGLQRTKPEIKRDFDYLARLWDEIRETTLSSSAPALIHSDSDLIKRAIRDIYNRDIEEVVVEGEEGYKSARAFMKLLMPSHVKRVRAYSDPVPLFQRYGAEDQLSAMYDPVVQLKSGGYLVINPTEALVSIDINSGRSTKEHGIEQTALNTNLEAAREIARQLRLRDMAGLVVIDFIDMEYGSSVRKVEKAMKEALKNDRARIQIGRISGFGLMEMSRQRLRTGVLEATTRSCPHCDGTGLVRTASSAGLAALRLIEDEAAKGRGTTITLYASAEAAIYLLNTKRDDLAEIESRYGVHVEVFPEGEDEGAKMRVTSSGPRPTTTPRFEPIVDDIVEMDDVADEEDHDDEDEDEDESEDQQQDARPGPAQPEGSEEEGGDRKKRRRRRRGGRNRNKRHPGEEGEAELAEDEDQEIPADDTAADESASEEPSGEEPVADDAEAGEAPRKRRRRNGRRRKREDNEQGVTDAEQSEAESVAEPAPEAVPSPPQDDLAVVATPEEAPAPAPAAEDEAAEEKPRKRTRRRKADVTEEAVAEAVTPAAAEPAEAAEPVAEKPKRTRRRKAAEPEAAATPAEDTPAAEPAAEPAAPKKRTRTRKAAPKAETAPAAQAEEAPPQPAPEPDQAPAPAPAAGDDSATGQDGDDGASGEPRRRGWWQRTFGA